MCGAIILIAILFWLVPQWATKASPIVILFGYIFHRCAKHEDGLTYVKRKITEKNDKTKIH